MPKKIAIITARSGSKGLKNKNMLFLVDKPMCCYSIDAAIDSNIFDEIIFSTDSREYIKNIKKIYHNKITYHLRSKNLSKDNTSSFETIWNILKKFNDNVIFCLLQPTSPLRDSNDIINAFKIYSNKSMVVSVYKNDKDLNLFLESSNGKLKNLNTNLINKYQRQNSHDIRYIPNGAIYIANKKNYIKNKGFFVNDITTFYVMSKTKSIDIDSLEDFNQALFLLRDIKNKKISTLLFRNKFISYTKNINKNDDIFIGDSLVEQWSNLPSNIKNFGISGITSNEYLELLKSTSQKICCKNLFILIGNNDLLFDSPSNVILNINKIINKIKCDNYFILSLTNSLYRNDRDIDFNLKINNLNVIIKREHNKHFIDINKYISKNNKLLLQYTTDGLHLNNTCYNLLNKVIFYDK